MGAEESSEENESRIPLVKIISELHSICGESVSASSIPYYDQKNASSYGLSTDLDLWTKTLAGRREQVLYDFAAREFLLAFLTNCQGQYRNAFKSLRLVLELVLQGAYLSTRLVALSEWLASEGDTFWHVIIEKENGVLGRKFCRAFFPDLVDEVDSINTLAATIYREMSECIHGNVPNLITLSDQLKFDETTFLLWHEKVHTLRLIINFVLCMRYINEVDTKDKERLEEVVLGQLSHIGAVRSAFGGSA